jgi:ribonuclease PH
MFKRPSGRSYDELRSVSIVYDVFGYASGSVLFSIGNTKVLCAVSLVNTVPPFLKGKNSGWLTAEYAMLPTATHIRTIRDANQMKRNDRSVEISRLIGRSLRSVVDVKAIGARTIYVDCDVLQADGSTRTACITGAYLALKAAEQRWLEDGIITHSIIKDALAAVSVGYRNGQALLDLDFAEDSVVDVDYNFVLTKSEQVVEIQGSAEKKLLSWDAFDALRTVAIKGVKELFTLGESASSSVPCSSGTGTAEIKKKTTPLFSLQSRIQKQLNQ